MKAFYLLLLCFAGCGTINTMNSNMQEMNGTIELNIETIQNSTGKIEENTAEVVRSTEQMADFKKIIASNTNDINVGVDGAKEHATLFPIVFLALIALLLLPTAICIIFYYMFFRTLRKS